MELYLGRWYNVLEKSRPRPAAQAANGFLREGRGAHEFTHGGTYMEGFTIALALVDAIPVLSFGISMVIIASRFHSPLFLIGACLSVLAGCCKVAWKLVLGIWKKDLRWLNKPFLPMQITGFGFILGSLNTII
jgi:hypothetical protein